MDFKTNSRSYGVLDLKSKPSSIGYKFGLDVRLIVDPWPWKASLIPLLI